MINSSQILKLLAERHKDDVFVPECKDGPSQGVSHFFRMDAWVMTRSWANMAFICYETKISRSDFLSDGKWQNYLQYCNEFYFVAPQGIIDPRELPEEAGLIVCSKNAARLFMKKKAAVRKVEIPESLLIYVLMCRSIIRDEQTVQNSVEYWKQWLDRKKESRDLGWKVARSIRDHVEEVERENSRLKGMLDREKYAFEELKKAGLDPFAMSEWRIRDYINETLEEMKSGMPDEMNRSIGRAIDDLNKIREFLSPKAKAGDA